MGRIVRFLKSTAWISRVFFFLWLYVALLGNFKGMSRLEIIFESALYFLSPAIIVEIIRSCFNKNTSHIEKNENGYANVSMQTEQSTGESYLIVPKIAMIFFGVLSFLGIIAILVFGVISTEILPPTLLCAMLSLACGFFYLNAPKTKAEAKEREKAKAIKREEQRMRERPLRLKESMDSGQEISEEDIEEYMRKSMNMSVFCACILVISGILAICVDNTFVRVLILLCTVMIIVCAIASVYDSKIKAKIRERQKGEFGHRTEQPTDERCNGIDTGYLQKSETETGEQAKEKLVQREERYKQYEKWLETYKGIYLTGVQIRQIENKITLPRLITPVFLDYDEVAVYHSVATWQEATRQVVERTDGYLGETIRDTNRFSFHMGNSPDTPVYGDIPTQYDGEMVITNKRLVFLSNQKGFEVSHDKIIAETQYSDGLSIQSDNHTYMLIFPKADLAISVFDAVRKGAIPIELTGSCNVNAHTVIQAGGLGVVPEKNSKIKSNDISSIDGMNGHEFEYFCADILRKNGFSEVNVTKGSGDQGVDILAVKDGIKYAIQCKNYASALSNTPVQEVNAGKTFYNCHVGVVMTNSTFTQGAEALAQATGVLLWNREVLQKMMEASE